MPPSRDWRAAQRSHIGDAQHFRETVAVPAAHASDIRNALRTDISISDGDGPASRRYRDEAQQVMEALLPSQCGIYIVRLAHDVFSRTIVRISMRATDELCARVLAEARVERSLVEPAIDTLATLTALFDSLVQESAGGEQPDDDGDPEPRPDKTLNLPTGRAR